MFRPSWPRSALLAIALGSPLLLGPDVLRYLLFGDPALQLDDFVTLPVWVMLGAAMLTLALRWGQRWRLAPAALDGTFELESSSGGTRAMICLPEPRA